VRLPTQRKVDQVTELTTMLRDAEIAIGAAYQGLPMSELTALRRTLGNGGVQMRVVKNTLLRRAATEAGRGHMASLAVGPTAILVGSDPVETSRAVMQYVREHANSPFQVRSAALGEDLVSASYVQDLSTVPPRDQLIARIAGNLTSKVAELAGLLQATTRDFASLIDARAQQLEGQA
jgi:large subunit ribosomal protein L10